MLQNRIWPNSNPLSVSGSRPSHSRSLSPSKCGQPYEEDDPAYLSSSSSKSSASSLAGRKTRRHRPNGRVNGMIASFERSASPDKAEFQRDRSGSISSVEDNYPRTHSTSDSYGRPLPFPPPPAGDYLSGPLLLPQTSFPNSFPQSFDTRQPAGLSINTTPHVTGNGAFMATPQPTESPSRPLPATPLHPSLRPPPVLSDDDSEDESAVAPGNKSGEMTMEELISVLNPDADTDTNTNTTDTHAFINTDRRRGRDNIDKRKNKGAAAWEVDVGETVKHAPANPVTEASQPHTAVADDELSVEELLALEGGPGAAAWVDQPKEAVQTMKRVGPDERENGRFGSISKGRSVGKASTERISLSAGRKSHGKGKTQARRVGELFSFPGGVKEERPGEEERKISTLMEDGQEAEERELERMRLVERELMCAEEEERQRWVRQAEEEAEVRRQEELRAEEAMAEIRRQEAVRAEEERIRQEERLRELFQRQKRMEEERQHQVAEEAAVKERQAQEEAAVERRRQLEAEERLALSIAENRRLLEEFRRRLEQVEQRIEEFQIAAPTSTTPDPQAEDSNERLVQRLRTITAWALSTPLGAALPAAVGHPLALFVKGDESTTAKSTTANSLRSADESASTSHRRHRQSKILAALYPKTFRRYTLLFGVGMCVFMLQGLMRWGVKGVQGIGAVGARGVRGR
ncbi:hypothetical protein H0H87_004021 [Tephrocybe sp. NHM501043]|nr:hypothetical protein H0H87_004021 [Tephrocybe sp. NHM501043]